jgi:hypothetical protein
MSQTMKEQAPRSKTVGITLPAVVWKAIDRKRGDVPTSKYFLRLAEKDLGLKPIIEVVNAEGRWENESKK